MTEFTMLDIRKHSDRLISGLRKGESYLLSFRGTPIGRILPLQADRSIQSDDPIYSLSEIASHGKGSLTSEEADKMIYG